MSNIFTLAFPHGHKVQNKRMVKDIVKDLMSNSFGDKLKAGGIAVTTKDKIYVVKDVFSREEVYDHPGLNGVLNEAVKRDTDNLISIIGHCHKTLPSGYSYEDLHPIAYDDAVGAVGGSCTNAFELFQSYKFDRKARFSGEAFVKLNEYLFDKISLSKQEPMKLAVAKTTKSLTGRYRAATVFPNNPYIIWLANNGEDTSIVNYYENRMLLFAENRHCLDRVDNRWGLGKKSHITLLNNHILGLNMFTNKFVYEDSTDFSDW